MVLGRRSFLRSLAAAVVGVGIAPKIFLAQTEIVVPEMVIRVDPNMPPNRIDFLSPDLWGIPYYVVPANHGTYLGLERSSYFSQMKEPHGY